PEAAGVDPQTGCRVTACVDDVICPQNYAPVCATNGQTYGNLCELNGANATQLHAGECVAGEGVDCSRSSGACGSSGTLYCRDACPFCDAEILRCTKVGVCVFSFDCPAGLAPPPAICPDGGVPQPSCVNNACQYS